MTIGNYFLYDLQKFRAILKGFTNIMVILEVIWEVVFVFFSFEAILILGLCLSPGISHSYDYCNDLFSPNAYLA